MSQTTTCESRKRFARNLKTLRQLEKKTMEKVAEETGFAYSYISSLEKEEYKKNPSFETIDRLANYYGVDISTLFM